MKNLIYLSLFFLIISSCSNDEDDGIICHNFRTSLIFYLDDTASKEIRKLTDGLKSRPVDSDPIGHKVNLERLIDRMNSNCSGIIATEVCYACIPTNPWISEIKVELDSAGFNILRIIDIDTPKDKKLIFNNIHAVPLN